VIIFLAFLFFHVDGNKDVGKKRKIDIQRKKMDEACIRGYGKHKPFVF
jgi:hypothetical protein